MNVLTIVLAIASPSRMTATGTSGSLVMLVIRTKMIAMTARIVAML